jgi:hypothetical protein
MDEREEPDMDRVRRAMREHDERVEEDEATQPAEDDGDDDEEPSDDD